MNRETFARCRYGHCTQRNTQQLGIEEALEEDRFVQGSEFLLGNFDGVFQAERVPARSRSQVIQADQRSRRGNKELERTEQLVRQEGLDRAGNVADLEA